MDSISIAQNIILRYRQAQEREWNPGVSIPLHSESSIYTTRDWLQVAGQKRKFRDPDEVVFSDSADDDSANVNAIRESIHVRTPSSASKASTRSPDPSHSPATPPLDQTPEIQSPRTEN